MKNVDQIAKLLSRNGHVNPVFRAVVADSLMKIGEEMAAEKIKEGENESQNMG